MRAPGELVEHDFEGSGSGSGSEESSGKEEAEAEEEGVGRKSKRNENKKKKTEPKDISTTTSSPEEGTLLELKRVDEVYDRKISEWVVRDSSSYKNKRKKAGADKYAPYAFLVHRKFNPTTDPTLHIITTTIDVRSEWIRKVGVEVIGQVQGITWTAKPLRVSLGRVQ